MISSKRQNSDDLYSQAGLGWAMLTKLGWRWLLAVSSLPLLCLALLYPILPESPYWLAATGRTREAEVALRKVAHVNKVAMPRGSLQNCMAPQVSLSILLATSNSTSCFHEEFLGGCRP